ncbi:MAG: hypothetical protein QM820_38775 [Minicystis sp.]
MKSYLAAFSLFAVIAGVPAVAYAEWHCTASPDDDPSDRHESRDPSRAVAEEDALGRCQAIHPNCVLECHWDP